MSTSSIDPVRLGLIWRRLDGIVDQVAETFVRAAFSVVVRDNYDMAFSLFDTHGRQLTQSKRSIPSFLGTLPRTLAAVRERFPLERLAPGDTLISNNAWIGTGHLNDISMVHPIFRGASLVAYAASTAHSVDIGGAPSPSARDCYEEGSVHPHLQGRRRAATRNRPWCWTSSPRTFASPTRPWATSARSSRPTVTVNGQAHPAHGRGRAR